MKKTLFLHIGYHKTGTTSIQNFFYNNRNELLKEGVLYPEIGLSGPTHALLALSLPGERDKIVEKIASVCPIGENSSYNYYSGPTADELYEKLGYIINNAWCEKILLSSECFLEWIDPSTVYQYLKKYCDCEIKVIVYIKRQDLWIQSVFNQVVRDRYLRYAGNIKKLPQNEWLDYYNTLKKWSDQFGKSNLLVRVYKKDCNDNNCTISDIMSLLDIKSNNRHQFPKTQREKNIGLNYYQTKILHELNCKGAPNDLFEIIVSFFSIKNEKDNHKNNFSMFLDYKEALDIFLKYQSSNKMIAEKFLNQQELFSAPTVDEYSKTGSLYAEYIAEIIMHIFELKGNK